jgi:serine-type D-Ala-D-Ala carboxypeptidase (penicillin-binding protein 5/6)
MQKGLASLLLVTGGASLFAGAVTATGLALRRVTTDPPPLLASVDAPQLLQLTAPAPPAVTVPGSGSFVLVDQQGAQLAAVQPDVVRPIGSVAKTLTALLTLRAHPLAAGASGPVLTMTQQDVTLYRQAVAEHGSAVAVSAGERLTERQLLLALLLPSANNIAETLARWVAGGDAAFDAQLNLAAQQLGMRATHFADPSGFSPQTVSTAADLAVLGRAALASPALEDLVSTQSASLPGGIVLHNLDVLLGSSSARWLGIKTGWTPQAGGCLLFAAEAPVGAASLPAIVIGAVLDQPPLPGVAPGHPELGGAFRAAQQAVVTALAGYSTVDLAAALQGIRAALSAPWGGASQATLVSPSAVVLVRGPVTVRITVVPTAVNAPVPKGTVVAVVSGAAAGEPLLRGQLVTGSAIAAPDWVWKLLNN